MPLNQPALVEKMLFPERSGHWCATKSWKPWDYGLLTNGMAVTLSCTINFLNKEHL